MRLALCGTRFCRSQQSHTRNAKNIWKSSARASSSAVWGAHPDLTYPAEGVICTPLEADLPRVEELLAFQRRFYEVRGRFEIPALVIDSLLPQQRLKFASKDERLQHLAESGEVGIFGLSPTSQNPLMNGVVATITHVREDEWEVCGQRHVRVIGPADRHESGIVRTRAEFVEEIVEVTDVHAASSLPALVEEWCELVRGSRFERFSGQLGTIMDDLGPMPPVEEPGRLAFWVAALMNPPQGLGVAQEIRPAMLMAATVQQRLRVAQEGIEGSIGHVSGRKPLDLTGSE